MHSKWAIFGVKSQRNKKSLLNKYKRHCYNIAKLVWLNDGRNQIRNINLSTFKEYCLKTDKSVSSKFEVLTDSELFFAALIHLVFVKIHPFDDGNGRAARLLEKWFTGN